MGTNTAPIRKTKMAIRISRICAAVGFARDHVRTYRRERFGRFIKGGDADGQIYMETRTLEYLTVRECRPIRSTYRFRITFEIIIVRFVRPERGLLMNRTRVPIITDRVRINGITTRLRLIVFVREKQRLRIGPVTGVKPVCLMRTSGVRKNVGKSLRPRIVRKCNNTIHECTYIYILLSNRGVFGVKRT